MNSETSSKRGNNLPMQFLTGKRDEYSYDPADVLRSNGKFAIVYRGTRRSDHQPVIVKKLHPRHRHNDYEIKRFRNEFRPELKLFYSAASLELITDKGNIYIIREYIPGIPLDEFIGSAYWRRMRRRGELFDLTIKILDAVREIHEAGYIHADLKPSNFIYNKEDNSIKVIDLGLSFLKKESKNSEREEEHPLPFSYVYSAPEIMLNFPALIDERSDVYSLGIIIWQLFAGDIPWKDPNPAVLMNLQLVYPLPPHPGIPGCLMQIIAKSTQKYSFSIPPSRFPGIVQSLNLGEAMEKRYPDVASLKHSMNFCREVLTNRSWFVW